MNLPRAPVDAGGGVRAAQRCAEGAREVGFVVAHHGVGRVEVGGQHRRHAGVVGRHLDDAVQPLHLEHRALGRRLDLLARDIAVDRFDADHELGLVRGQECRRLVTHRLGVRQVDASGRDLSGQRRGRESQLDLRGQNLGVVRGLFRRRRAGDAGRNRGADQRRPFLGIPIASRRKVDRSSQRCFCLRGGERPDQGGVVDGEVGKLADQLQLLLRRRAKTLADVGPEIGPVSRMLSEKGRELLRLPGAGQCRGDQVLQRGDAEFRRRCHALRARQGLERGNGCWYGGGQGRGYDVLCQRLGPDRLHRARAGAEQHIGVAGQAGAEQRVIEFGLQADRGGRCGRRRGSRWHGWCC